MTINEFINILPPKYGDSLRKATVNRERNSVCRDDVYMLISRAGYWRTTVEGEGYWIKLQSMIENHEDDCKNFLPL